MMRTARDIAHAFIAASEAGAFPEGLCCADMVAWTTLQSEHSHADYSRSIAWMREKTDGTLKFVINAVTSEAGRIVIEAHSTAQLVNGEDYSNTYVFILALRDGKIESVREHYNALVVQKKLIPLMAG
jgi:uncharacterized protein